MHSLSSHKIRKPWRARRFEKLFFGPEHSLVGHCPILVHRDSFRFPDEDAMTRPKGGTSYFCKRMGEFQSARALNKIKVSMIFPTISKHIRQIRQHSVDARAKITSTGESVVKAHVVESNKLGRGQAEICGGSEFQPPLGYS